MAGEPIGRFEAVQKQRDSVVELRPTLPPLGQENEVSSSLAKGKRREVEMTSARRKKLLLQLGDAPTKRKLSSERMKLNEQYGTLRAELNALNKESLNGASRSEERSLRIKEIETEMNLIRVRRDDITYFLSLDIAEADDQVADVKDSTMAETDKLRRVRDDLEKELNQTGASILYYFRRRKLELQIREIDQQTRASMNRQRRGEAAA